MLASAPAVPGGDTLTQELNLPKPNLSGQMRSQRLFSVATGIDPRSLRISNDPSEVTEFFLFMQLREERQWASFRMTPFNWLCATSLFNTKLEEAYLAKGYTATPVLKAPRALMEKLGDIEQRILVRLTTQDFMCKFP